LKIRRFFSALSPPRCAVRLRRGPDGDGDEGLWYAEQHAYDVIILDLMLPGWMSVDLQRLRRQGQTTQVLLLTAKDTIEDRVRGLHTGAEII